MKLRWCVKPTGKNSEIVKDMVTSELNSRGMDANPQLVKDTKGMEHIVYEVLPEMINYLSNCRASRNINFRVFKNKLGSTGPVAEDKFIYVGRRKRTSVAKSKSIQCLKKLKNK